LSLLYHLASKNNLILLISSFKCIRLFVIQDLFDGIFELGPLDLALHLLHLLGCI
jgi:hypothetical protein